MSVVSVSTQDSNVGSLCSEDVDWFQIHENSTGYVRIHSWNITGGFELLFKFSTNKFREYKMRAFAPNSSNQLPIHNMNEFSFIEISEGMIDLQLSEASSLVSYS
jgi:hypothetical protein